MEIRERRRSRGDELRYAYRVRFQNAHGERKGRTFDRAEDAQDFRAKLRLLKREGDLPSLEAGRETLMQFMSDYWRLYVEPQLAPSTCTAYGYLWNKHIFRRLGAMELRQITPLVLSELILEFQHDGISAHTIQSCLSLLQGAFARAVEWDRVRLNPVKQIAKPRAPRVARPSRCSQPTSRRYAGTCCRTPSTDCATRRS